MSKIIYVVDDDLPFCKLIAVALREDGFNATAIFTGEDALTLYDQQPPDLMLLDVAMPGLSGFDVTSTVRERDKIAGRHTLIIIMTAHARSFAVSVGFNANIDSYLTKPVLPFDVLAHVHTLLDTLLTE